MVLSLFLTIGDANAFSYFPPPLKQITDGVLPENITCAEGLQIVLKHSNNLPACVKASSIDKLLERGWAMEIIPLTTTIDFETKISEKAIKIWNHALDKEHSEVEDENLQGPTDDGYEIIFYDVSGDEIFFNQSSKLPSFLQHWQDDATKHHKIWNVFVKLIPESQRNVNQFYITTDGIGMIGGGVNRDLEDVSMWSLFYDISDVYPNGVYNEKEVIHTTIHEFGHILTSNIDQIEVYEELVDFSSENYDEYYDIKSQECFPNLMVVDGCAKSNSYINQFYQEFWGDISSDWDEIQMIVDDDEYYEESDLFYEKYQDHFVTVYASTNIDEDIAESWTAFVLNDKPTSNLISSQKIQFFYDFPELVELREHIRQKIM